MGTSISDVIRQKEHQYAENLYAFRAIGYISGAFVRIAAIPFADGILLQLVFSALPFGSDRNAVVFFGILAAFFYGRIRIIPEFARAAMQFVGNETAVVFC